MGRAISAAEAAARLRPRDTLGIPLGPGQPPAFMAALGDRDDWEELRIGGALLLAWSEAYRHPGVHILSGFWGPVERALRDQGANISFAPADFRRFAPLLEQQRPRVMATVATPPDEDGWCSLSLHAGGTYAELSHAAADPDRLLVVEVSERFPRTRGLPPEHRHAVRVDDVDVLIESEAEPFALPEAEPGATDEAIAAHARPFIPDGATLQTGIGTIPSAIVAAARRGRRRRLRRPQRDVHRRADGAPRGRQGDQPQGAVRRRLGRHLRRRIDRALPLARRQRRGRVPAGRGGQLTRPDRPQPDDGDDQRRARGRHPRPGGRGHDRRRPVLGHRRSRGLHLGARALARGPLAALPALDRRDRRRGAVHGSCPTSTPARSSRLRATRST